jgi:hypothetical protein
VLFQLATPPIPPSVIHDTVAAVARGPAFDRTLRQSLADRLLHWIGEGLGYLARQLGHSGLTRPVAYVMVAIILIAILARLVIAAQVRDPDAETRGTRRRADSAEDAFALAQRLASEGRYEEAAHAIYRGVLLGLARTERIRLDASKTSGDYLRELRVRGSASAPTFRSFARRFDVAVYGHGGCDARLIDDLVRLAAPLGASARAA